MRDLAALSCVLTLASSTLAFSIPKRFTSSPKVVQHTIQRREIANPLARDRRLRKRASTVTETLTNEETLYFANISLGTPAQDFSVSIDTGSSDLWVNTPNSQVCTYKNEGLCSVSGTYIANDSSTYKYLNSDFSISYADNSGASGDYATDVLRIGGVTIDDQQFGIGYNSTTQQGILGVGYTTNEASVTPLGGQYPNVPVKMVQSGLINTAAYSLWLNDLEANTGSILFGGVDTDKYSGTLSILPIIQQYGEYSAFFVALTGVGMDGNDGSISSGLATAALLDSGTSLTYLPNNITSIIYEKLDLQYNEQQGAAYIDCSRANDDTTIDYTFSSPTISVSLSELVIPIGTENGQDICVFGIAPADNTPCVLGDTFLRSAYVVYDTQSNQIGIAQTVFNAGSSNVQEITNATSTDSGIPNASGVANAVSVAASNTATGAVTGGSGSGRTSAATLSMAPNMILQGLAVTVLIASGAMMVI